MALISGGGGSGGGAITQLSSNVLSGSAANFDVSSLAASFNHLLCVCIGRSDTAAASTSVILRFNNDSGANYERQSLSGSNASVSAAAVTGQTSIFAGTIAANTASASSFGTLHIIVPFYAGTTAFKNTLAADMVFPTIGTVATYGVDQVAGMWKSTTAISRVTLIPGAGNFVAGSSLTIYGML